MQKHIAFLSMLAVASLSHAQVELVPVSSIATGDAAEIFDESAAEIVKFDPVSQRLFVVNAYTDSIDVIDIRDIENPMPIFSIDVSAWGSPNSVDVNPRPNRHEIAVAVENGGSKVAPGYVVFFDTDGNYLADVPAGSLPDMLTYDKTGKLVIVANEGEPNDDYSIDPEGSVTIVDVKNGPAKATATQVTFEGLNGLDLHGIRISGPAGTSNAQDLEPEFIAVSPNNQTAYVACQENNALVFIDLKTKTLSGIVGLGYKDHMIPGNGLDASNKDDVINIANWPVRGLYMPDSIVSYEVDGEFYLVTANEGDSREYEGYTDEERVKDALLDPVAFPDAGHLQESENLGRIKFVTTEGNTDGDPEYEGLYTFGARSFTIWTTDAHVVYDSGNEFEKVMARMYPHDFNSNNDENDSFDSRSDDKGPEPEGIAIGKVKGRTYAFIGLERMGGIMVYDISNPAGAFFVTYVNNRDFTISVEDNPELVGDLGPEGLVFIPASKSPSKTPLLVVGNEVSGTTTIFEILPVN